MSTFTLCFDCPTYPVKIPDMLRKILRQDDDGTFYVNIYFNQRNNCDLYELAYDCNEVPPLESMVKDIIVEDDCGDCALNVLINICDTCEEEEQIQ